MGIPFEALVNATTASTTTPLSPLDWGDPHGRFVPLTVLLILLIFIIVFGNSLVVLAVFYERRLRLPSNYYVVSLAVSDLAIGIAVLPVSALYEIARRWLLGQALCRMWISTDITCCTASIINLGVISFDRYRALSKPMRYPQYSTAKRSCITIAGIWMASLAVSGPTLFGVGVDRSSPDHCQLDKRSPFVVYSACGSFFIPLGVMLVLYRWIFKIADKQRKKIQRGQSVGFSNLANELCTESDSEMSLSYSPCLPGPSGSNSGAGGSRPLLKNPNRPHNLPALILQRDSCSSYPGGVPFKSSPKGSLSSADSVAMGPMSSQQLLQSRQARRPKQAANPVAQRLKRLGSHTKAAKTLGIVVGAFVFCWGPFFFTYLLHGVCHVCHVPDTLVKYFVWLGYCNSFLNPIIYPCLNKDFRRAFRKLLTRHYCRKKSLDYWNSRRQSVTRLIKASRHLRISIQDTNYTGSSGTPPESPYSSSRSPSFFSSRSGSFLSPMDALKRSRADSRQSSEDDGSTYQELLVTGRKASWKRRLSSRRSSSRRFSFLSSSSGYTSNRTDQRLSCASTDTRSTDMTDKGDQAAGGANIDSKDQQPCGGASLLHPLSRRQSLKLQPSTSSAAYQEKLQQHQQHQQHQHQQLPEDPDAICEEEDPTDNPGAASQMQANSSQPEEPQKRKSRTNSLPAIFEKIEVKLWQRRRSRKSKKIREWLASEHNHPHHRCHMDASGSTCAGCSSEPGDCSEGEMVGGYRKKESTMFHHPIRPLNHPAGMTRRNTVSGNRLETHRRPSLLVNDTLVDFSNNQDHRLSIYTIEESPRRESGSSCSGFSFSRTSGFRVDKDREGSEVSAGSQGEGSGQTSPKFGRAKRESLTVDSVWNRVSKARPRADSTSSINGHRTPSPSQSVVSQTSGFGLEHLYSAVGYAKDDSSPPASSKTSDSRKASAVELTDGATQTEGVPVCYMVYEESYV